MLLRNLTIHGFGCFGAPDKPFELDLRHGLNLIVGPNEAGKSTLQTCIVWTLLSGPLQARNRFPPLRGGPYRTELTVETGDGTVLRVVRDFAKRVTGALTVYKDTPQGLLPVGESDWEDALRAGLGTAERVIFERTACIAQGDVLGYCRRDDLTERKEYDRLREVVEAGVSGGAKDQTTRAAIGLLDRRLDGLRKSEGKTKDRRLEEQRKRVAELRRQRDEALGRIQRARREAERASELSGQLVQVNHELDVKRSLLEHYVGWRDATTAARQAQDEAHAIAADLELVRKRRQELGVLAERKATLPAEVQRLASSRDDIAELGVRLEDSKMELNRALEQIAAAERERDELVQKAAQTADEAQTAQRVAELTGLLRRAVEAGRKLAEMARAREELADARRELASLGQAIPEANLARARELAEERDRARVTLEVTERALHAAGRRPWVPVVSVGGLVAVAGLVVMLAGQAAPGYVGLGVGLLLLLIGGVMWLTHPAGRIEAAFENARGQLEQAESALHELLQSLGADEFAELQSRAGAQSAAGARVNAAQRQLEMLAGQSDEEALRTEVEQSRTEAVALRDNLGAMSERVPAEPSEADDRAAQRSAAEAATGAAQAGARLESTEDGIRNRRGQADALTTELEKLTAKHDAYLREAGTESLEELVRQIDELREIEAAERRAEEALHSVLRGLTEEELSQRHSDLALRAVGHERAAAEERKRVDPGAGLTERELAEQQEQTGRDVAKLDRTLLELQGEMLEARAEARQLEASTDDPVPLSEALALEEERLRALEHEVTCLELAREMLADISAEIEQRVSAPVLERATQVFREVAAGHYESLSGDELNLRPVSPATGESVPAEALSYGTQEQLAFAARYALAEAILGGPPPLLILDDPFGSFDAERLEHTLAFLIRASESSQILLFTHDERYAERLASAAHVIRL